MPPGWRPVLLTVLGITAPAKTTISNGNTARAEGRGGRRTVEGLGGVLMGAKLAARAFDGGIGVGRVGSGDGVLHGS